MGALDGQVVVVTGAGRGIGRAYANFLANAGAAVVVNDKGVDPTGGGSDDSPAAEVAAGIVARGGAAVADLHDVSTDAQAIIGTAVREFGRIDGIVNNAGIISTAGIEAMDPAEIDRMLGVHVHGPLGMARAAWPHMRAQQYGRIVNISSVSVFGVGGAPLYPTAKAAIVGLTRALAIDGAADGIKVNCVMPMGASRLAETQAGLGQFMRTHFPPELIAPFVGALLTRETPVTGESFAVAGGRAARVFLGTVPGLTGFTSIEDCLEGFVRVMDSRVYVAPTSMDEEIAYEWEQVGIDLSALGIDLSRLNTATT